jgi:hypothetical protein
LLRLIGILLLLVLVSRIDLHKTRALLSNARWDLVGLTVVLNLPLIGFKAVRWRQLMSAQVIRYRFSHAFSAYFGSIFIGLLTPGRLGEFVKALYISQDCGIPMGQAFSSVLADRLFDLYVLFLVGGAALVSLTNEKSGLLMLVGSTLLLSIPLAIFLNDRAFRWMKAIGLKLGHIGRQMFSPGGWLVEMRDGLQQLTWLWLLAATTLTVVAYIIFFGQCYLLALALGLKIGFVQVSFAVALGSLVTLLPISISGLGTREAAIIAYLGSVGVPAEMALGFSLLVFVTFYVAGGLMGAVAWWIKPVSLAKFRVLHKPFD